MNINLKSSISFLFLLICSPLAWADLTGLWQEYDDDTGKLAALIRIDKRPDNVYEGVVEKAFMNAGETGKQLCTRCSGDLYNHTLLGLPILTGMKRKDRTYYEGGQILDPGDGKIYKCRIQLDEDENTLQVTGFINFTWIGQSEIWRRAK